MNVAKLVKIPVPKYKIHRGLTVPQARRLQNHRKPLFIERSDRWEG